MTKKHLFLVVSCLGLVLTIASTHRGGALQAQGAKPVRTLRTFVDRYAPGTLDLSVALSRVDDVTEVTILGKAKRPIPVPPSQRIEAPTRYFDAVVIDTYKQSQISRKG